MRGAILGDIIGSTYEFHPYKSKDFPLFNEGSDFTDDTVCTVALGLALLDQLNPAETLHDFCKRYPHRGYGGMFRRWIRSDDPQPYHSFGNGAAMRVSNAALLATSFEDAIANASLITAITHNHPEGLKGAYATTAAIWWAFEGKSSNEIRQFITEKYNYDLSRSVDEVREVCTFNETCQISVPEALICALEATDFIDAIRNAVSIGGDADTQAAIAGAVAEARFGIPNEWIEKLDYYLSEELNTILLRLYAQHAKLRATRKPIF